MNMSAKDYYLSITNFNSWFLYFCEDPEKHKMSVVAPQQLESRWEEPRWQESSWQRIDGQYDVEPWISKSKISYLFAQIIILLY